MITKLLSKSFNYKRPTSKWLFARLTLLVSLPFLFSYFIFAAPEHAGLQGVVYDSIKNPIAQVRIILSHKGQNNDITLLSSKKGTFQITGLSPGEYSIKFNIDGYQPHVQNNIQLEPSQTFYIETILSQNGSSYSRLVRLDYTHNIHQTIINHNQLNRFPSAHNIWSVIENQDLSATTNRIDTAGLWSGIPALFSARGGCSWTQNTYLLNGMDVTDPYQTGKPLFYPDFFSLNSYRMVNAGNPPYAMSPGGYFDLSTRNGGERFQGGVSTFYTHHSLQSTNITPDLEQEGLLESHGFDYFNEGNFHFSGPVIPEKLYVFSSVTAFGLARNLADYSDMDKSSLISGLLSLKYKFPESSLLFLWTGQNISHPSYGAERNTPFSSTLDRRELYNVFQVIWDTRIHNDHYISLGASFSSGDVKSDFQETATEPYSTGIFRSPPAGAAPSAYDNSRKNFTVLLKGESLFTNIFNSKHKLQYGFQFQNNSSSSQKEIRDNIHLLFFGEEPLQVIKYNSPVQHRESSRNLNLYLQDTLSLSNFFSVYLGFNFAYSQGWIPIQDGQEISSENRIDWLNFSPRIGIIIPLNKAKTSALKFSFARYFYKLQLNYLSYGNPDTLAGLVYEWDDSNQDKQYQPGESGILIQRQGSYFASIDPDLKRPFTDEIIISYSLTFGSDWYFYLGGFHRTTYNLIHRLNTGVSFDNYHPLYYSDIGDDRIPFSYDDLLFTIYEQDKKSLGQDYYLLTNMDSNTRTTSYFGLDLNLIKKFGPRFTFFLSLTATQAAGHTNPGNTEWENDDGIVGVLFDNLNNLINAEGRVRFDRAYTGRLGLNYQAPFGIRISGIIKYYDGQPFSRKIIITGLNQGPFYIQAHPRGISRYEYNKTVDIRLEKIITIGKSRLRIIFDGFNILNRHWATEENEWTGPDFPLRYATEIQYPRIFRLGLAYDF